MSRRSDNGRQRICYAIDVYGIQHTPVEQKRREKSKRLKALQRKARKVNRGR